jgi:hypothetical protein
MKTDPRFVALGAALRSVSRKRLVRRDDVLVVRSGRLRCEAYIDLLDRETPITIEVEGGLFPIRIYARDVGAALAALKRYGREREELRQLFSLS